MLTVTDFIKVILHYRNAGKEFSEFETQKNMRLAKYVGVQTSAFVYFFLY